MQSAFSSATKDNTALVSHNAKHAFTEHCSPHPEALGVPPKALHVELGAGPKLTEQLVGIHVPFFPDMQSHEKYCGERLAPPFPEHRVGVLEGLISQASLGVHILAKTP